MGKYLIEKDGEKQWVGSLKGYGDDWTLLGTGKDFAPKDDHKFEGGKWVPDLEAKAKADRVKRRDSLGLIDLDERLRVLEEKVAALTKDSA